MITDVVYIEGSIVTLATRSDIVARDLSDSFYYLIDYLTWFKNIYNTKSLNVNFRKFDLEKESRVKFLKCSILSNVTKNILVKEDCEPNIKDFIK